MISERTSTNENFEYGDPHSNALLQTLSQIGVLQAACHPTKCEVINDVNYFRQYIAGYTGAKF